MFLAPLRNTKRDLAKTVGDEHRKTQKLMFVDSKMFVLAATASATTVLAPLSAVTAQIYYVGTLNTVVDSVCMILISPYLSENDHCLYLTVCRIPIYCCWCCGGKYSVLYGAVKQETTLEAAVGDEKQESTVVDTMSAPRVFTEKMGDAADQAGAATSPEMVIPTAVELPTEPAGSGLLISSQRSDDTEAT